MITSNPALNAGTSWKVTHVYDTLVPPFYQPLRVSRVLDVPVADLAFPPSPSAERKLACLKKYLTETRPPKHPFYFERIANIVHEGSQDPLFMGFSLFERDLLGEVQDMRAMKVKKSAWDSFVTSRAAALPYSEGFNLTIAKAAFQKFKNILKDCSVAAFWTKPGGAQEAMITSNSGRHFMIVNAMSTVVFYHGTDTKEAAEAYITDFLNELAFKGGVPAQMAVAPSTVDIMVNHRMAQEEKEPVAVAQ